MKRLPRKSCLLSRSARFKGTLQWSDEAMGYGLIAPALGGADVFVIASEIYDREVRLRQGQAVQYSLHEGRDRPTAFGLEATPPGLDLR